MTERSSAQWRRVYRIVRAYADAVFAGLCLAWALAAGALIVRFRLAPFTAYSELFVPLGIPIALGVLLTLSAIWRARIAVTITTALTLLFCILSLFSIGLIFLPCVALAVFATLATWVDDER